MKKMQLKHVRIVGWISYILSIFAYYVGLLAEVVLADCPSHFF